MRRIIALLLFLVMAAMAWAQSMIGFVSAEQYQTVAGWRLHCVTDGWGDTPFPPSNYEGAQLMLSNYPMGLYPPYDAIAVFQSDTIARDPEFRLLGKLDVNTTWYGRLLFMAGGMIFAQTGEFNFIFPGEPVVASYRGKIPYGTTEFGWAFSYAIANRADVPANITATAYYSGGGLMQTDEIVVPPHAVYARYGPTGWTGSLEISSDQPGSWAAFYIYGDSITLDTGELE